MRGRCRRHGWLAASAAAHPLLPTRHAAAAPYRKDLDNDKTYSKSRVETENEGPRLSRYVVGVGEHRKAMKRKFL